MFMDMHRSTAIIILCLKLNYRLALMWILLNILSIIIRVAINNCFVCESLFLNNSVTADKLGVVNGLAACVINTFQ